MREVASGFLRVAGSRWWLSSPALNLMLGASKPIDRTAQYEIQNALPPSAFRLQTGEVVVTRVFFNSAVFLSGRLLFTQNCVACRRFSTSIASRPASSFPDKLKTFYRCGDFTQACRRICRCASQQLAAAINCGVWVRATCC